MASAATCARRPPRHASPSLSSARSHTYYTINRVILFKHISYACGIITYFGSYLDTPEEVTFRLEWIVHHIELGQENQARIKGWVGWRVEDGFEEDECVLTHPWHI